MIHVLDLGLVLTGHQSISDHYKLKLVVSIICFFAAAFFCGIALKVAVLDLDSQRLGLGICVLYSITGTDSVFVLASTVV